MAQPATLSEVFRNRLRESLNSVCVRSVHLGTSSTTGWLKEWMSWRGSVSNRGKPRSLRIGRRIVVLDPDARTEDLVRDMVAGAEVEVGPPVRPPFGP
jgi:hypothetical protein